MQKVNKMIILVSLILVTLISCEGRDTARTFDPTVNGNKIYNGICYGPHRDGQRPGGVQPSEEQLLEDLRLMLPHWKLIRIYSSSEFAETLLSVISEHGMKVKIMLGVWIDPEERRDETGKVLERFDEAAASNRAEVNAAIHLANRYPDIVSAVSVGNETRIYWSAHRSPLDILIGHVRRVREGVDVPVTVADDFNYWNKPESRKLAAEIDFITMHAHPMWNGLQLENAMDWLKDQLQAVKSVHQGQQVIIGETGWATSFINEGEQGELIRGKAGEPEQSVFYREIRSWAENEWQIVFFFEAFDENWKGGTDPDEVEKHWGLFRADRTPKEAMLSGKSE